MEEEVEVPRSLNSSDHIGRLHLKYVDMKNWRDWTLHWVRNDDEMEIEFASGDQVGVALVRQVSG